MAEDNRYQPINCEIHDGFELACMRRAVHKINWIEEGDTRTEELRCIDLESKAGEEFLIAENRAGEQFRIRLDWITSQLPY